MKRCTGTTKATGLPCKLPPIKGGTVCHKHGGKAPQVRRKAAQRLAVQEAERVIARLGGSMDVDPLDALLDLVRECAANVFGYRSVISAYEITVAEDGAVALPEETIYGERSVTHVPARVHVLVEMYDRERDRLARYAKLCLDAGIDERRVRLAEVQGRGLAEVVKAAVEACAPTDAERAKALAAAGAVMRRLGAEAA